MEIDTHIIVLGQQYSFSSLLIKILTFLENVTVEFIRADENNMLHEKLLQIKRHKVILVIDAFYDNVNPVIKWLWNGVRLSEGTIGRELAGIPVVLLGIDKKFLEAPEGKVFQDFSAHHQYLIKPLNMHSLLKTLNDLSPVNPSSLPVINSDAPHSVINALEHDLKDISKKFNFSGTNDEINKRFSDVEVDLRNYERLQSNKLKIKKAQEEVLMLESIIRKNKK
jgi:hypothetical protein